MEPAPAAVTAAHGLRAQTGQEAMPEAFVHRGYVLTITGYFIRALAIALFLVLPQSDTSVYLSRPFLDCCGSLSDR